MRKYSRCRWLELVEGILLIILGIITLVFPTSAFWGFSIIYGVMAIVTGKAMIAIVWNMRLPRVLLGLLAGAGLALCGCVMQATVNNPISEPYILGVSSGATFGATLLIVMGLGAFVSGGAFVGAVIATVMVLGIASGHGKMTTTRLILAGTHSPELDCHYAVSIGSN